MVTTGIYFGNGQTRKVLAVFTLKSLKKPWEYMQFLVDLCTSLGKLHFYFPGRLVSLAPFLIHSACTGLLSSSPTFLVHRLPDLFTAAIPQAWCIRVTEWITRTRGHSSPGTQVVPRGPCTFDSDVRSNVLVWTDCQWIPRGTHWRADTCASAIGSSFLKAECDSEGKIHLLLFCARFLSFQIPALSHFLPNFAAIID